MGQGTGVIKGEVSDNMILFLLEAEPEQSLKVQESELFDVQFRRPKELADDPNASVILKYILDSSDSSIKTLIDGINPGDTFGYTAYKLFL